MQQQNDKIIIISLIDANVRIYLELSKSYFIFSSGYWVCIAFLLVLYYQVTEIAPQNLWFGISSP